MNLHWYPVVRFPLETDLRPFLNYLESQNIIYHVTEEQGQQQLWITDGQRSAELAEWAASWASGELVFDDVKAINTQAENEFTGELQPRMPSVWQQISGSPIIFVSILLGFVGFLLVYLDRQWLSLARPFLFFAIENGRVLTMEETLAQGQYWRLLTPVFLHFSLLHIIFNALIVWEIGRRIEWVKGHLHTVLLLLGIGIFSNVAQYYSLFTAGEGYAPFGGLSGFAYGLIGYVAVYQEIHKHSVLQFNKAAIAFFIVWLILGVLGIIDFFIAGKIANTAHVSGLLLGALLGLISALMDRSKTKNKRHL